MFIPNGPDLAAIRLQFNDQIPNVASIPTTLFLDKNATRIGVGEDVFMIGLFVDHNGISKNVPSARFGNISLLPNEMAKIPQETGYNGVSYIIDMHSRSGFSGSPVYVYRTFGNDLTTFDSEFESIEMELGELELSPSRLGRSSLGATSHFGGQVRSHRGKLRTRNFMKLLGIHWGQFPELWELKGGPSIFKESSRSLVKNGAHIEGVSGMTCVIPAWQILELLNSKFK